MQPHFYIFCYLYRIGDDWTEICDQPELRLSSSLEFNAETTEKVNLPLTRRPSNILSDTTENTTDNPTDAILLPTESANDKQCEDISASCSAPPITVPSTDDKPHEHSKCSKDEPSVEKPLEHPKCSKEEPSIENPLEEPTCLKEGPSAEEPLEQPTCSKEESSVKAKDKSESVFVFSIENVPSGCYYLSHPNKYVFPGSTHTWYGSGNLDKDRELIFEEEDDDEVEIDYDDDDDDIEDFLGETESSTNNGENSESEDGIDVLQQSEDGTDVLQQCEEATDVLQQNEEATDVLQQSDSALLGKRIGEVDIGQGESVSPAKQQKTEEN